MKGEFLVRRTSLKIKYAQSDIFCVLRKLKPILAGSFLFQIKSEKKWLAIKFHHKDFFCILWKRIFPLRGKGISALTRLMPRLVRGRGIYRRSLSGRIFTSSFKFWAHCFLQTKVASGECATIISSTPSRAVARPAASNTRQFLESFA